MKTQEGNKVVLVYSGMAFSPAFLEMRRLIASGRLGRLGAMAHWAFSDWMLRPREPHEVEVDIDGGQLLNQGPHPVDALRLLGGDALDVAVPIEHADPTQRAGSFIAMRANLEEVLDCARGAASAEDHRASRQLPR